MRHGLGQNKNSWYDNYGAFLLGLVPGEGLPKLLTPRRGAPPFSAIEPKNFIALFLSPHHRWFPVLNDKRRAHLNKGVSSNTNPSISSTDFFLSAPTAMILKMAINIGLTGFFRSSLTYRRKKKEVGVFIK